MPLLKKNRTKKERNKEREQLKMNKNVWHLLDRDKKQWCMISGCCFVSLAALWRSDYFLWLLIVENKTADFRPTQKVLFIGRDEKNII